MTDPHVVHTDNDDDEIDLLDLLLVVAENVKLLILGPLLVGLVALGIAFALPKTYESQSILNPSKPHLEVPGQVLASLIKSTDTIEAVADATHFEPERSAVQRIKGLEKKIHVTVGKQDQLLTIKTQAQTPEAARALNQAIWDQVLPLTKPRDKDMARLQAQLTAEQKRLVSGEKLEAETAQLIINSKGEAEGAGRMYGDLLTANSARLHTILALESQMEGLTSENLAQLPTLPEESVKPKKGFIAVAATLATGFILLLFVFARHAFSSAGRDPEKAAKVQRIRRALGLRG